MVVLRSNDFVEWDVIPTGTPSATDPQFGRVTGTGDIYRWDSGGGVWVLYGPKSCKIYTALLTATGPLQTTSGPLIVGDTYTINTYVAGDDFTNVANIQSGIINTDGCVFIATGTTPTDYSNGSILDPQGNPVPTILENTIGNIVWTRTGMGDYFATLSSAFTTEKTWAIFIGTSGAIVWSYSVSQIEFQSFNSLGAPLDDYFAISVEIRVYP